MEKEKRAVMGELSNPSDGPEDEWRLERYDFFDPIIRANIALPLMTNGHCTVTALDGSALEVQSFKYEETWVELKIEFEFEAMFVGGPRPPSRIYLVFLGRALEKRSEYWTGSSRDNELLYRLMANIRQALCLLKGKSEERIKTVEFVLSSSPHFKSLSNFQSEEIVR
jgi:hypothetical protein